MTTATSNPGRQTWHVALFAALAVAFALLMQRNLGLNPTIFADEWYYSKMARLMELKDAIVPSYLYLWMFGASNACGPAFLECVRIGNVLLYLGATPFVYLTARAFTSRPLAFLVALMATAAPLNIYTAYFMPEATYYFGFCVLSWVALTRAAWHPLAQALACGVILGIMSLVKVHAVFLIPALALFLLFASWQRGGAWLWRGLAAAALASLSTIACKFGIGYLLAGDAGLSIFGPFYQGAANSAGSRSPLLLLPPAFINARGHLMALAVLLGLPLALLASRLAGPLLRERDERSNLLHVYALLMLGSAAGLTILYTATLAAPGNEEGVRLHLRYYSFVFPLLWTIAAVSIGGDRTRPAVRWTLALLVIAVLAVALFKLPTYSLNAVDGPDIYAIKLREPAGQALLALNALVLLLWAAGHRHASALFLYVAVPAMLAAGLGTTSRFLAAQVPDNTADRAGRFAHTFIPAAEHGKISVAGVDLGQVMRAQFHIDHKDSAPLTLAPDSAVEQYQLPVHNKWLLILGRHPVPAGANVVAREHDYTLLRVDNETRSIARVQLSEPFGKGALVDAQGLSTAEPWGRWSDSGKVVLHFDRPLPRRLSVILKARAYDINTTLPFSAHVGGSTSQFRLGWDIQEIGLRFETDGNARELVIDVPQPVSPAERGQPWDPRKLGIGIAEIEIGETVEAPVLARH